MRNKQAQDELYTWYAMMMGVLAALPENELNDLAEWEKINAPTLGTSAWPGWKKYIGPMPQPPTGDAGYKKQTIPREIRWQVWERDNFTCQKCGSRRYLTVDHIFPESKGGTLDIDNLQTLCRLCNSKKGNKSPQPD